jgi:hypothetical protein
MEFDFRDWYDKIDVPSLGKEVINSFLIEQGFTSRSSLLTLTEADIPDAFGDQDIKIGWKRSLLQNIQSSIKNGDEGVFIIFLTSTLKLIIVLLIFSFE